MSTNFLQDIRIAIVNGAVSLTEKSFRILVYGEGSAEIPVQIVTEASQLLAFGYLSTDKEYKKALAIFSQAPTVVDIAVYRKATATAWDTGLDTLKAGFNQFWGILIGSTESADQYVVEAWAGGNKKFFYALSNSVTIASGRNQFRASYMVHDLILTSGYSEISSSGLPFLGGQVTGLLSATYDLDVKIDIENSGAFYQLAVAVLVSDDWDAVAGKIETALQSASTTSPTVAIVNGKIKITSVTTGDDSKVEIQDGTAGGTAMLDFITKNTVLSHFPVIDLPVNGFEIHPEASHMGRKLGREPFKQWKWKALNGIPASTFNITQLTTIRDNKSNTVTAQAGQIFTNGGFTSNGSYIDLLHSIDYIEDQLTNSVLLLLLKNESVGMTDGGIALIESALRSVLDSAGELGIIAELTDDSSDADRLKSDSGKFMYKLNVPLRSEIPENDRANRLLSGITFSYTTAGAVDEIDVDGTLEA